jgi:aerobic carbon-monoxide dehydrogenase medium subunit
MYDFNFHRPANLAEALKIFADSDDGQFIAGGQTIIPVMKQRLSMSSDIIDLGAIADLNGISVDGGIVSIGAMTPHANVAVSDLVNSSIPALAELAGSIGDPHVRNRGTLGGSIANNDPAADYPAGIVGLGALVRTNTRSINGDDFFTDLFETALDEGELITGVDFPIPDSAAYEKFANPASRFAMVGVMISRTAGAVRVAVTGAGPCVFRVAEMEQALTSDFSAGALDGIGIDADGLNTDIHASAEYRAHLIGVLAGRAVSRIA